MTGTELRETMIAPNPLRILIAEDNPADLELTIRELKESGLDVKIDTVITREAFAEKLRSHSVDMVLSDYRMPGLDGRQLYEKLKSRAKRSTSVKSSGVASKSAEATSPSGR